jgi:hypothetical protein
MAALSAALMFSGCNTPGTTSSGPCKTSSDCVSSLSCLSLASCPGGGALECYKTCTQNSDCTPPGLSTKSESPGLTGFVCESCEGAGGGAPTTGTKICIGVFDGRAGEAPAAP